MPRDPEIVRGELRAIERAQRHAEQVGVTPQREPIDPAVFKERCRAFGNDASRELRDHTVQALEALNSDLAAMRRNPTQNAAQIEIAVAQKVRERAEARYVLIDVRRQRLLRERSEIEIETERVLWPQRSTWAALAPELRTMLRAMQEKDRDRLIGNLDSSHDDYWIYAHAIVSAPAAASGVSAGQHHQLRNAVLGIKNPALLTRPLEIKRELQLNDECEEGFRRSIAELVDLDNADSLKRLAGGET